MPGNIFIGMGSNVGNRLEHLRWAVQKFDSCLGLNVKCVSSVYESEAHTWGDKQAQDAYYNAVIELDGEVAPRALLEKCLHLEMERGRVREPGDKWEPRTLDLDILAFNDLSLLSELLMIPHPRIAERYFVLEPWHEIAPDFVVPEPYGKKVVDLLANCTDSADLCKTRFNLLD